MTARLALASLFLVAAVLARPWQSPVERWVLGISLAAVLVLIAWWGGLFLTTRVGRLVAMLWRNLSKGKGDSGFEPAVETIVLRVDPAAEAQLPIVVSYLDRYGIRCDKVRVTHRDGDGARRSWISLTVAATDNLAALQARSSRIPLRDTAEVVGRRLADHLRENGWTVTVVDGVDTPLPDPAKETWRGVKDESGFAAAYRVAVTGSLADTLAAVRGLPARQVWTVLEFTGDPSQPQLVVGCAVHTDERPGAKAPVPGLTPQRGRHRPALRALSPRSSHRLDGRPVDALDVLFEGLVVEPDIARKAGQPA
ncbi:type VII secretion protein EccE [Mycolicibacterium brisbanense]|uniref:Transmembrane protein n=1 Tax=Mycolicibacterium brisbanense TaxID=146020 RepID=A0A100W0D2_9MYCO|nr:type VII secretion protein EccE [Mycolicibacterium brisbanense]MCV7161812.1 type VII secretion protein EccE [Mycolicibacterium brisbanense]GAS89323.1 transmembrane protein [Mycolicibacterium brisbanense]